MPLHRNQLTSSLCTPPLKPSSNAIVDKSIQVRREACHGFVSLRMLIYQVHTVLHPMCQCCIVQSFLRYPSIGDFKGRVICKPSTISLLFTSPVKLFIMFKERGNFLVQHFASDNISSVYSSVHGILRLVRVLLVKF